MRAKLLRDDRPWNVPRVDVFADEIDSDVLYRRLISRLPHRRLLVVAADGDHAGRAAAERLAALAGRWFTVVTVSPARPVVADTDADGVLVVTSLGSRSAWELVGIAEAVADAGLAMVGTVLIRPVRPARTRPGTPTPSDHEALAGTA